VAMAVAGTSLPCSGGCHEIGHAIEDLYPGTGTHGEQVGLGALWCAFLRETRGLQSPPTRVLRDALRRHGLPVTPAGLGLDAEQFARAVERAPFTRPGRYTVLEHLDLHDRDIRAAVDEFTRYVSDSGGVKLATTRWK
jgi:glycerol-1-phosphate dehydrogenase [NAD(P)+]